jgi:hypothetical protein
MKPPVKIRRTSGDQRKEVGQKLALDAKPSWSTLADTWFNELSVGETFTSEDMTDAIGMPRDETGMNKNNAVGAKMGALAKARLIVPVDYVKSSKRTSNSAVIRVWMKQ